MAFPEYLESTSVEVSFPNVRRETNWRSRLNSESAFTDNVKSLTPDGKGTFIVNDYKVITNGFNIRFYLSGYYFSINLPNDDNHIWVGISIDHTATSNIDYMELVGQNSTDETPLYTGLKFADTEANLGDCSATLQLLVGTKVPYEVNSNMFLSTLWKTSFNDDVSAFFIDTESEDGSEPLDEDNKVKTNKIWIDLSDHFISRIYYNGVWVKLGAVYK